MNTHVDPHPHGATPAPAPSRLVLTERDERILALREEGVTAEQIGAALGISARRVVERVTKLRRAGHPIRSVARERGLTCAPKTFVKAFCEHRVYVVPVDPVQAPIDAAWPGANAEARRQHREAVERRRRMAIVTVRAPAAPPAPVMIVTPASRVCEPIGWAPAGEQINAHVLERLLARKLAGVHPVQRVVLITARHFGVGPADITGPSRRSEIVRPRQVAMYLACETTKSSAPEIGRRIGDKDHTTILHAAHKIEGLLATDRVLAAHVAELRTRLAECVA